MLLEVTLGRIHLGRCVVLRKRDHQLAALPLRLTPGQLLLRPRRRAPNVPTTAMKPAAEIPYLALSPAAEIGAAMPADDPTEAITPVTTLTSHRFAGGRRSRRRRQRHAAPGRAGHVALRRAGALPGPGHRESPAGADRPQLPAADIWGGRQIRPRNRRGNSQVQIRTRDLPQRPGSGPADDRAARPGHPRARLSATAAPGY